MTGLDLGLTGPWPAYGYAAISNGKLTTTTAEDGGHLIVAINIDELAELTHTFSGRIVGLDYPLSPSITVTEWLRTAGVTRYQSGRPFPPPKATGD